MSRPLLTTKLFIPPTRPELINRPYLVEQLNDGLNRKLTLISAPAGFGKTTLVTEWLGTLRLDSKNTVAWLSIDEGDNDLARFLTYFIAALNRTEGTEATIGEGSLSMLQSPQPLTTETILTPLINDIAIIPHKIIIVLDDFHLINAKPIHDTLNFFLEHVPPQVHLAIATREDPHLPLTRFRARGQLTELRAADLRFTSSEAAEFLNQVMGLDLSYENITRLETRTEGWIVGLQLAAISMKKRDDTTNFIQSFSGSHRLVLDYLIEEVLDQQPERIRTFLLKTSILDQLTGSLCDALTRQENGQQTLNYLEQANLFIVPLDDERRWYRYHHLFADLLRQRVHRSTASSTEDEGSGVDELHSRASVWYEDNGLEIEAFQHAAAGNDVERAARLVEGNGVPLHYRSAEIPVLNWLESLPTTILDARPSLWVIYASALMITGRLTGIEEKLKAAEAALDGLKPDDKTKNLLGIIASSRAALSVLVIAGQPIRGEGKLQAVEAALQGAQPDNKSEDLVGYMGVARAMSADNQQEIDNIIFQSRRALAYLHPDNLIDRASATWMLGIAYQHKGDRAAATQAYTEAISMSQSLGNNIIPMAATIGLGNLREGENQLHLAAESYRRALQLAGDPPLPAAFEAHLGLARVSYQWNELDAAHQHGQQSVQLAQQIENTGKLIACEVFLAHLKLAQGYMADAAAILAEANQLVRQNNFVYQIPDVAAAQVRQLLHQGNLTAAAQLAERHELPIYQARVHLAQGKMGEALALLKPLRQQMETRGWVDEKLKVMVLQALVLHAQSEKEKAVLLLGEALVLAEQGGFIRIFVDEGPPMARLLFEVLAHGISPNYVQRLLESFPIEDPKQFDPSKPQTSKYELVEPLSEREIEVLQLIAEGFTKPEIASKLYLSPNTVKVHSRNIYSKLGVNNRTQASIRAKALGILPST